MTDEEPENLQMFRHEDSSLDTQSNQETDLNHYGKYIEIKVNNKMITLPSLDYVKDLESKLHNLEMQQRDLKSKLTKTMRIVSLIEKAMQKIKLY